MATYLERYQNGEREQVWAELIALGPKVRQQPMNADALAVARETMTRARANVETIYQRLKSIGYAFEYPDEAFVPPTRDFINEVDKFEREVGPVPLSLRAWCEIVGEVNFIGNHRGLASYGPTMSSGVVQALESNLTDLSGLFKQMSFGPGVKPPDDEFLDTAAEKMKAMFPGLMNTEFLDLLKGSAQKAQEKPSWKAAQEGIPQLTADPLVVQATELSVDWYEEFSSNVDEDDEPFFISIAPDELHKANVSGSGGFDIHLPDAAADVPLVNESHHTTFVNYLRISFQWGGFPGLEEEAERDDALIQMLKEGLLAI